MNLIAKPTAGHEIHGQSTIYDETTGRDVAIVYDGKRDAANIVRACNLFDELRTAAARLLCGLAGKDCHGVEHYEGLAADAETELAAIFARAEAPVERSADSETT